MIPPTLSDSGTLPRRRPAPRSALASVAATLPPSVRTSEEIEQRLRDENPGLRIRRGTLITRTGIRERRVVAPGVQCSDLAVSAAREALAKANRSVDDVDLLIFAAASQDLIEPATAHIVQHKLGTRASVFDVKNACNSFVNGLQLADLLVTSGSARCALVVTGEICSNAVRWKLRDADDFREHFPSYTMGDAGAAALVVPSEDNRGIRHVALAAQSEHWPLAMIRSGGSMFPRGDEFTYLSGDGPSLKNAFVSDGPPMLRRLLAEAGADFADFDRIFVHQVGVPYHREMLAASGIPEDRVDLHVVRYGNMAAASLPVAHALAVQEGRITAGDRVLWLGMASGISVGIAIIDV
jgi:3-oxoacyl-(acyl-carrier-protein) synthase III